MSRPRHDRATLAMIAVGGVAGASLRWLVTHDFSTRTDAGWFSYAPNTAVTFESNPGGPFGSVRSAETLAAASGVPYDTLGVNLLGCLLLGALTYLLTRTTPQGTRLLVAAAAGFCGSLTTFSTFAVELATLVRGKPVLPAELKQLNVLPPPAEPAVASAIGYIAVAVVGGAVAFWLGRSAARRAVVRSRS